MYETKCSVTLTLQGPFLTKSPAAAALGVDAPLHRNKAGKPIIPWTLIKGRLRHTLKEFEELGVLAVGSTDSWLGKESGNGAPDRLAEAVTPIRGFVEGSDFALVDSVEKDNRRYRNRIDRTRGSVDMGAYQVIESPFQSGQKLQFSGEIRVAPDISPNLPGFLNALETGLKWTEGLGALTGIGFGRLLDVKIGHPVTQQRAPLGSGLAGDVVPLELELLDPFCVNRRKIGDNFFETEEVIPGSAIKGAVAQAATGFPELLASLHLIRFPHFFPVRPLEGHARRPLQWPLSLSLWNESEVVDALKASVEFKTRLGASSDACQFEPDWKQLLSKVKASYGWPKVERSVRVRTAISLNEGRAETGKLFAVQTCEPGSLRWVGSLNLELVPPGTRDLVGKQLRAILEAGLGGLTKTKARARVSIRPGMDRSAIPGTAPATQSAFTLTLQTPALLCDPETIRAGRGSAKTLQEEYGRVWSELSGGALQLVDCFSREELAGGYYLHRRFQSHAASYQPWLLTMPGSVFLFKPLAEAAFNGKFDEWSRLGLPLPAWVRQQRAVSGQPDWQWCPYVRENGYGEFVLNVENRLAAPEVK